MWSIAAGCGRAKWAAWWGSSFRCSPWSTCISSPTTCRRSSPTTRSAATSCRTSSISSPKSTCARSAPAWCSAPMRRPASRGSPKKTPWDFGRELLPPDLDRIAPNLELGYKHFPALAKAGIKRVINGPFTFSPDGNPLVGPVQGLRNFWCACAVMAGFSQGGGVGLALSQWMVNGDPGFDVWAMDAPASANGRRAATPTRRCARIIRAASRSASPTRNCPRRGRSRPRRSTT